MTAADVLDPVINVRLALFDIDGTILSSGGAGRRAMLVALEEVFGTTGPRDHPFDGKTDPQIVRELMRLEGHDDAWIDGRMAGLHTRYLECLTEELGRSSPPRVYPGVRELLNALERRGDVVLGLLTGNLREGAEAKLRAAGINPERFRVGAYGSDHEERPELPAVAQRRAREALGMDVAGSAMVVIGDTPADMRCGLALGARAIGVATGSYDEAELRRHGAAAVFPDLSDTDAVVRVIVDG